MTSLVPAAQIKRTFSRAHETTPLNGLLEAYSWSGLRPRLSALDAFEGNTSFRRLPGLWIELQPHTICKPR